MTRTLVLAACLVLLAACSKKDAAPPQTEGALGEVDLASKLPSGVTVPADVKTYDVRRTVCHGVKGDTPIDVRVKWKAFMKDGTWYIASYYAEVIKPEPGVFVQLVKDVNLVAVKVANSPPMTASKVTVKCSSRPKGSLFEEGDDVFIRADGVSSATPFSAP